MVDISIHSHDIIIHIWRQLHLYVCCYNYDKALWYHLKRESLIINHQFITHHLIPFLMNFTFNIAFPFTTKSEKDRMLWWTSNLNGHFTPILDDVCWAHSDLHPPTSRRWWIYGCPASPSLASKWRNMHETDDFEISTYWRTSLERP